MNDYNANGGLPVCIDPLARAQSAQAVADGAQARKDIDAMKSIGRYLSVWDCTTGLPQTDPTTMPYTYQTGDYYRVGVVAAEGGTNYKPSGTTYTGAASTSVESGDPALGDIYIYDGTSWGLLKGAVLLDETPTEGSTNAVTSGGAWNAVNGKEAKGKITIGGVEKTANTHTVTIVTNGVESTFLLVGVD